MRIFLPKLSPSAQNELLVRFAKHAPIPSCATIEALRQSKNPFTPTTIATQARHFQPFQIWAAAHVLVHTNDFPRLYDIPAQFLIPYNLANYPSRRIEKYAFLNLPVDIHVGDQLFAPPRAFKQLV